MIFCYYCCTSCRSCHPYAGAWWLGMLGFALACPAALENAALDVDAYSTLLESGWELGIDDVLEIIRGREV